MEHMGEFSSDESVIDFKHLTVTFDDPVDVDAYLQHVAVNEELAQGISVYPIKNSSLYTELAKDGKTLAIGAFIKCARDDMSFFDKYWQKDMLSELKDYYDFLADGSGAYITPKDANSLYVTQGISGSTIKIHTYNRQNTHNIRITSVTDDELFEKLSGQPVDFSDKSIDEADYNQLHAVAHAWAKVQNIIFTKYSDSWDDEDYKRIHIGHDLQYDTEIIEFDDVPPMYQTKLVDIVKTMLQIQNIQDDDFEFIYNRTSEKNESFDTNPVNYLSQLSAEFEKIGGHFAAKERLTEIGVAYTDRENASRFNVNASSFLLQGPPGTGKTELVEAFARATNAELVPIGVSDITGRLIGESTRLIEQKFNEAKDANDKVILFFDEIDTLISEENHQEFRNAAKRLGTLVEEVAKRHPNIIVASCMNAEATEVMEALIRPGRLEIIPVNKPETYAEIRDTWFSVLYRYSPPVESISADTSTPNAEYDDTLDIIELAKKSGSLSGAEMESIVASARSKKLLQFKHSGTKTPISQKDLLDQISTFIARRASDNDY